MPTDTRPTLKMKTSSVLPTRTSPEAFLEKTSGVADVSAATVSAIASSSRRSARCVRNVNPPESDVNASRLVRVEYRSMLVCIERYSKLVPIKEACHAAGATARRDRPPGDQDPPGRRQDA